MELSLADDRPSKFHDLSCAFSSGDVQDGTPCTELYAHMTPAAPALIPARNAGK